MDEKEIQLERDTAWASAALDSLIAHCIEQALEAQAFIDLMWGDFE